MSTVITSASNPTIKHLRQLASSSKARREHEVQLAEGIHLVRSLLDSAITPVSYFYAENAVTHPEVAELLTRLSGTHIPATVVSDTLFESITSVHASVGIAALFSPDTTTSPALLQHSALLLEDVQDPGNLGTILRTAAATGIKHAYLSPGCASPWSPKALRAGMGAQFSLTIHERSDLLRLAQTSSIQIAATTLSPNSVSLFDVDLTQPTAWIFGNEGQGVQQELLDHATTHVLIPQAATAVESLNVAAAAAVCLYEQYRQTIRQ